MTTSVLSILVIEHVEVCSSFSDNDIGCNISFGTESILSSKSRGIASLSLPVGNGAPRPKITPPLAVRTTTVMTVLPAHAVPTTFIATPEAPSGGTVTVPVTVDFGAPNETQTASNTSSPSKSFLKDTTAVTGVFTVVGLVCAAIIIIAFLKSFRHRFAKRGGRGAREGEAVGRWRQEITPFPGPAGAGGFQSSEGQTTRNVSELPSQTHRIARMPTGTPARSLESPPSYTSSLTPYRPENGTASEVAVSEARATAPSNSVGDDIANLKDVLLT